MTYITGQPIFFVGCGQVSESKAIPATFGRSTDTPVRTTPSRPTQIFVISRSITLLGHCWKVPENLRNRELAVNDRRVAWVKS